MNERTQTNSNGIISITLGVLSMFIPVIGIVLGIIGIVFSRKAIKEIETSGEGGKGLATSGFVCSLIGVVIQLFGALLLFFFAFFTVSS